MKVEKLASILGGEGASESVVLEFEKAIGVRMPEDYRGFLLMCNGGRLEGRYWFAGRKAASRVEVDYLAGLRPEAKTENESLWACREWDQLRNQLIPKELIVIGCDMDDNRLCVGIHGKYQGVVYYGYHDLFPDVRSWDGRVETADHLRVLAKSFTEFVEGLRVNRHWPD